MNDKTAVAKTHPDDVKEVSKVTRVLRPQVDIFEDTSGITLLADMPGVTKEQLNLKVDKETLSIEGDMDTRIPEGMEAVYSDVRTTRYQRSFVLSGEMDTEKIEAGLHDGVLSLRIPKRAELQPRKIEVRVE
ncbi:MAG: Hsp20/alpha crystallin family protein [Gammaproteobacteria bacterium]|nr:Hsp20/alpha crystallin family protein [Gammaproteobacteria bacterium]